MVTFGPLGTKTCFNVPEAFRIVKLCKCHTKVLVKTGEAFDFVVSSISLNTSSKCMYGHLIHHLGKNESACVHVLFPPERFPEG